MGAEPKPAGTAGTRLFAVVFLLLTGLQLFLMATVRLYPFLDTPNHLAIATIYRYYGNAANQFARYYAIDTFLKPNVFHLFFCGSKLFPSVEFASRVFYCLYVMLFPLSILLVIKKIGGNQWFSLLSFLFLYNINVLYGFNGFIIAIPFVMFTFCTMLYHLENRTMLNGLILSALLVLIFFMHVLAALFALLIVCGCSFVAGRRSFSGVVKDCLPAAPLLILIAAWWWRDSLQYQGPSLAGFLLKYYTGEYFKTMYLRGGFLIFDNFGLQEGIPGYAIALLFSLFAIALVALAVYPYNGIPKNAAKNGHVKTLSTFMICSAAVFSLIPENLPGYSFLFERFSVFMFIALILLGSVLYSKSLKKAVSGAICVMCFLHFLLWADYFREFNKENQIFNKEFFSAISNDKRLAGLMYDFRFRGRSVYENFADYFVVWQQGITNTRVIDDRSFPIQRKMTKKILPPAIDWSGKYDSYDGSYSSMEYILVRGGLSPKAQHYMQGFNVARQAGPWALYERAGNSDNRN
jgi:hypothetical protein